MLLGKFHTVTYFLANMSIWTLATRKWSWFSLLSYIPSSFSEALPLTLIRGGRTYCALKPCKIIFTSSGVRSKHGMYMIYNLANAFTVAYFFIFNPFVKKGTSHIKKTPWSESARELYRPSNRRLSAKWLPTCGDRGCHVVSMTDPSGRILSFLDRSRYFSIK
jgi:hypothetical protein